MKNNKFYICAHCGNIVELVHDSGVNPVCCGQKMTELVPNDVLGKVLGDLGGGGDGEGRHHVRVDLLHGKGDGLVAGETVIVVHTSPPSFMVMAPKEQTSAQMPQPLQW